LDAGRRSLELTMSSLASRGDSKRALAVTGKHAHAAATRGHRDKEAPLLQCTTHMCPVRVHWHVKLNYKEYWRAKIAITNFNYRMNYTQWTLVAQHPNLDNITEVFSFDYKPVVAYGSISNEFSAFFLTAQFVSALCT